MSYPLQSIFYSADQYGSRFIQQKLGTATIEEKSMVYEEITAHGLNLMTHVFGNYVIQQVINQCIIVTCTSTSASELSHRVFI